MEKRDRKSSVKPGGLCDQYAAANNLDARRADMERAMQAFRAIVSQHQQPDIDPLGR